MIKLYGFSVGDVGSFAVRATHDPDGDIVDFTFDSSPFSVNLDGQTPGTWRFDITVSNAQGTDTQTVVRTLVNVPYGMSLLDVGEVGRPGGVKVRSDRSLLFLLFLLFCTLLLEYTCGMFP